MRVYVLGADVGRFRQIGFATSRSLFRWYQRFDGTSQTRYWSGKVKFKFEPRADPKGDIFSLLGGAPIFSFKAVKSLSDLLEPSGELLKLRCQKDTLFLYNVTRLVDALDVDNSDLARFSDGAILDIEWHSFREDRIRAEVVFKLPELRLGRPYVTEPFVQRVRDTGLKGFRFRLVWSTEEELDRDPRNPFIIST